MKIQTRSNLTHLSRAEHRRLERAQAKQSKTYTLTQAQLDQKLKAVEMEATKKAFLMMMGFPLLTLRDKFGFGKKRLNQFMDKMVDLYEAYEMDYVDLDDLNNTIMEETGVTLINFNPRTHEECDTIPGAVLADTFIFQSTHSRGVRLVTIRSISGIMYNFNPRTHEECDADYSAGSSFLSISIHALTRSATISSAT